MNNKTSKIKSILVIDSGLGGLSTLAEIITLTKANFIYFADNKNSPYGNKSDEFLKNRLYGIINSLQKKYTFSMVILACNTATTSAIKYLRNQFPKLSFIGTEPAYKLALDKNFKRPAILATPRTITNISKKLNKNYNLIPNKVLASLIEQNFTTSSIYSNFLLIKEIFKLKNKTALNDCLVLGCTHYVFIKDAFARYARRHFRGEARIIDGNASTARQLGRVLKERSLENAQGSGAVEFLTSGSKEEIEPIFRMLLNKNI